MRSRLEKWRHAVSSSDGPIRPPTRHVLLVLSLYMRPDGRGAWPSYDTLSAASALSRRAVIKHINFAVADGWLVRHNRRRGGDGWASNEYEIAIPQHGTRNSERGALCETDNSARSTENGERERSEVVNEVHTIKPIDQTNDQVHKKNAPMTLGKSEAEIAEGREYLRVLREQSRKSATTR